MEYQKFDDTYVIRMDRGEEVMTTLTDFCQREGIGLGYVSAIAAAERATVCLYDVVEKAYSKHTFNEPMEVTSLMGTVSYKNGQVHLHLHVTLSDADMHAWGGHLNKLVIGGTCEMFLRTLPGQIYRQLDEATGLNVIRFDQRIE